MRALNKIYKRPLTQKALCKLGSELGSDVPYCIMGKTALCEGKGEKITKIHTDIELNVIIASANEHVSTPIAYGELDSKYSNFDGSIGTESDSYYTNLENELRSSKNIERGMYNIFESVVFEKCPRSKMLKQELLNSGAKAAMMSGSGPSVFAIFESFDDATNAKKHLIAKGYRAWVAKSV